MNKFVLGYSLAFIFYISGSSAQNIVSTYAGSNFGYVDGDTSTAKFRAPFGMCIDADENIYIVDADNHSIRKITPDGTVSTVAGTGDAGYADGVAASSQFNAPSDICLDAEGNLYVSDFANQRIRKIGTDGMVTTIAGNGTEGYADGDVTEAEFDYPRGIVMDSEGNLFVCDSWNHRIRKINLTDMTVSTFAGGGVNMGVSSSGDYVDDTDTTARFYTPSGLAIDQSDNLYVADAYNHRIRMITPDAVVSTIAGSGSTGPGEGGYADGDALSSLLNTPTELFISGDGIFYISDTYNYVVRKLVGGMLTTVAGNTNSGYVDGDAAIAEFTFTRGLVADAAGEHIYVCDYNNKRIRKIWLNVPDEISDITPESNGFMIYPNPADGAFHILLADAIHNQKFSVSIEDMNGRLIEWIYTTCLEKPEIGISALPAGSYTIKLTTDQLVFVNLLLVR